MTKKIVNGPTRKDIMLKIKFEPYQILIQLNKEAWAQKYSCNPISQVFLLV